MKQPDMLGRAAEMLYADVGSVSNKVSNPPEINNLYGRPSLIPGVEYPISEAEQELLDAGYDKGYSDAMRINRAGHLVEDDPFLDIMRERVEQIRKEMIKKGTIKPATIEERKLRLGL